MKLLLKLSLLLKRIQKSAKFLILRKLLLLKQRKLSLKQFLTKRIMRGRKPWSVISDFLFAGLIVMLLIPSTRSMILSGVSAIRTWITNPVIPESKRLPLSDEGLNWNLTDEKGTTVTFSALRGEVIFLNQWATWCPPCRAELPSIERLYKKYGNQVKFVILTGEDPAIVREFMTKQGYSFPVYFGNAAGAELLSRSIPITHLINRKGEILISKKGAFNWNAGKVRRIIDKMLKGTG
jgi:thiol-disulfide isomerase/thioredoxin